MTSQSPLVKKIGSELASVVALTVVSRKSNQTDFLTGESVRCAPAIERKGATSINALLAAGVMSLSLGSASCGGDEHNHYYGSPGARGGNFPDGSEGGSCEDSPLLGRYLRDAGKCSLGMTQPFRADCIGVIEHVRVGPYEVNFSGRTISGTHVYDSETGQFVPKPWSLELVRPTPGQVKNNSNKDLHLCRLGKDPELYTARTPGQSVEPGTNNLVRISNHPLPGGDACEREEATRSWRTDC